MTAENLSSLRDGLCAYLAELLPDIRFIPGMPCAKAPLPTASTAVTVENDAVKLADISIDRYLGEAPSGSFRGGYGKAVEISLRFDIFHPDDLSKCHDAFSRIAGALLLESGSPYDTLSISSRAPEYDRGCAAFRLCATAVLRAFLSVGEDSTQITKFTVRRDEP